MINYSFILNLTMEFYFKSNYMIRDIFERFLADGWQKNETNIVIATFWIFLCILLQKNRIRNFSKINFLQHITIFYGVRCTINYFFNGYGKEGVGS